jgi:hypothetical protein
MYMRIDFIKRFGIGYKTGRDVDSREKNEDDRKRLNPESSSYF